MLHIDFQTGKILFLNGFFFSFFFHASVFGVLGGKKNGRRLPDEMEKNQINKKIILMENFVLFIFLIRILCTQRLSICRWMIYIIGMHLPIYIGLSIELNSYPLENAYNWDLMYSNELTRGIFLLCFMQHYCNTIYCIINIIKPELNFYLHFTM